MGRTSGDKELVKFVNSIYNIKEINMMEIARVIDLVA